MTTGIQTIGDFGYRFRSRLEERWAAFFTTIGWDWEYEPVDLWAQAANDTQWRKP